jgi:polyphosphate kinase
MGCHVIYGLIGLKTHSKIVLVSRRDDDGIRRYLHLGTGNYNDVTAHFYTDLGLLTCDRSMGVDATNLFNMLSGYSRPPYFHQLHISPSGIREFIYQKVDHEIEEARNGRPALIRMKMNSLSDQDVIAKLYEASNAGVKVQIIVRGICCLRSGIKGVSENIEVHSIVGRFLEHSRIYYFYNEGAEDIYLSSADMMTRNLNRRVELLFPIQQDDLRERLYKIFDDMWADNIKGRVLRDDTFVRQDRRGQQPFNSQAQFIDQAERHSAKLRKLEEEARQQPEVFQPLTGHHDD